VEEDGKDRQEERHLQVDRLEADASAFECDFGDRRGEPRYAFCDR
jgi:hypothetical protein